MDLESIQQTAAGFTAFDIAILLIIGVSTITAFGRGFVTVALSFGAWAGAFFIAFYGFEVTKYLGRDLISPPELADLITVSILFFAGLLLLKMLASSVGGAVKASAVGFLDRSAGALFGLLRGMLIVSVAYLAITKFTPSNELPSWVNGSKTKPLVTWGAEMVEGLAYSLTGKDPTEIGAEFVEKAADSAPSQFIEEQIEKQAAKYANEQREKMEEMIEDLQDEDDPPIL